MPAPTATTACKRCKDLGYRVLKVKGQPAHAQRCDCQAACPRCGESGYVLVPTGATAVAQVCSCRHLDQRLRLFNEASVPATVARATFENFKTFDQDQVAAKAAAEEFARRFRTERDTRGLLFYGTPGAGKTHLLGAIIKYLTLEKGTSCRYVEFMLLLSDIRAGFATNRGHLDILRPLVQVPVLAIDELGKERGTEWERSMLDELISRRYNAGLTTLFATNYFLEARRVAEEPGRAVRTRSPEWQREVESMTLAQRVGDRVFSRLNEMCVPCRMEARDYRALGMLPDDDWDA
jgi:DNA replication protein DnaC